MKTTDNTKAAMAIEQAMIALGEHANRESGLGRELDKAWEALDSILESIKDGNYNDKGEFVG